MSLFSVFWIVRPCLPAASEYSHTETRSALAIWTPLFAASLACLTACLPFCLSDGGLAEIFASLGSSVSRIPSFPNSRILTDAFLANTPGERLTNRCFQRAVTGLPLSCSALLIVVVQSPSSSLFGFVSIPISVSVSGFSTTLLRDFNYPWLVIGSDLLLSTSQDSPAPLYLPSSLFFDETPATHLLFDPISSQAFLT